jgi:hypothetical protein
VNSSTVSRTHYASSKETVSFDDFTRQLPRSIYTPRMNMLEKQSKPDRDVGIADATSV